MAPTHSTKRLTLSSPGELCGVAALMPQTDDQNLGASELIEKVVMSTVQAEAADIVEKIIVDGSTGHRVLEQEQDSLTQLIHQSRRRLASLPAPPPLCLSDLSLCGVRDQNAGWSRHSDLSSSSRNASASVGSSRRESVRAPRSHAVSSWFNRTGSSSRRTTFTRFPSGSAPASTSKRPFITRAVVTLMDEILLLRQAERPFTSARSENLTCRAPRLKRRVLTALIHAGAPTVHGSKFDPLQTQEGNRVCPR